ncbi:single-stranded DNA-binding protein [Streptomyces sp. SID4919]|uniref:single-stranded DNA-binding protein n=1 Tax=unclassified Streptomyces TaxID=2593676 RepID=UPI000823D23D|nr:MULTISPECIES: single-stranded DNA-binding protein [unclassified Streptomyces]MYY12969.1 single-stranded DNA-binding protein [Streptomyces sp. SID4919]SCK22707.1 single-strand DNA-binding protein [Streptomyces sp. AmelKG-E11A]
MNDTLVTVVGNVATAPVFRELPTGAVVRFRIAATSRYRDRGRDSWIDGHTNFFTVYAWRTLGENAAASLSVGEPVIVRGRLRVRQEDRGNGQQWFSADIEASSIGHDLARGTTAFRRDRPGPRSCADGTAEGGGSGTPAPGKPGAPGAPGAAVGGQTPAATGTDDGLWDTGAVPDGAVGPPALSAPSTPLAPRVPPAPARRRPTPVV